MAKPISILMLAEFFYPYDRGGSEWSTFFLSQSLIKKNHKVRILTPNYGTKSAEVWQKIPIKRFTIGKKLQFATESVSPFWHTNLYWFIKSLWAVYRQVALFHPDIIHVQGKYFLPAAIIVSKITGIPTVYTARDYMVICNLGFCLWKTSHRCHLPQYLSSDIPLYYKQYVGRVSLAKKVFLFIAQIRARFITRILYFWAQLADEIICVSHSQRGIFSANGFKKVLVIYNSVKFPRQRKTSKKSLCIYVGRLTPGKGVHLVLPSFVSAFPKGPMKLCIIGEGFLKDTLEQQVSHFSLKKRVKIISHLPHDQVMNLYSQAKMAIFPSLWPEPFGRGAMEAISMGTPTITSNKGGLPEIVNHKYGISVTPTVPKLASALRTIYQHSQKITTSITKDKEHLRFKFYSQPTQQYLQLYQKVLHEK